jgi:hypothetical protein
MTAREAALLIGIGVAQVRNLCRTGKLKHRVVRSLTRIEYDIDRASAVKYRDTPRNPGGRPPAAFNNHRGVCKRTIVGVVKKPEKKRRTNNVRYAKDPSHR